MDIRQMRYFLAVAEELHFRRAAERLHLSQPSLSEQIRQLEEELGATLFERSNRRVVLTDAGETLMKKTRELLAGVEQAVQETRQVAEGTAGTLSITFVSTALIGELPRALRAFTAQVPRVDIKLLEIDPEEQVQNILRGNADIGFMHGIINHPQLESMVVHSDALMIALPQSYSKKGPVHLRSLGEHTTILPSAFSSYGFSAHVEEAYRLAGVAPRKVLHVKLLIVGVYMVAAGLGICLVPECFRSVQVRGVVYRPLAIQPPPAELRAVWRRDSESKLLRRFLQVLHSDKKRSGEH
jgi:DNA-binding transcriptional LysR family regulator